MAVESTFGGGTRFGLVTITDPLGAQIEYLASERYRVKRGGITIAADLIAADGAGNKILKAGTVMAKLTGGPRVGKYVPYVNAGANGAGTAVGLLFAGDMNVKDGPTYTAGLLIEGSVLEARVTGIDATSKAALLNYIQFQ